MLEVVPEKVAAKILEFSSGWGVMPVSTSPITIAEEPWVMAQAGSMLMPETTFSTVGTPTPLTSSVTVSEYGARRYHWPAEGPFGATLVDRLPGYSGSLTAAVWT